MTYRVSAIEYDHQWNIVAQERFEYVEDAQAWCEARANTKLEWGDTQVGYEGNTEANIASLDGTGDYAEGQPIFQIQGIDNEDIETCREIEEEDHRSGEHQP